mgnify:CR=1 FL=1|tara:strand:- start:116 stop:571 length:456 start_codon:yes stop_codon:yes gene_type:complete
MSKPTNDDEWPMRLVFWDHPDGKQGEIELFSKVASKRGYAWVGCGSKASPCAELLVFKKGAKPRGYGIIQVIDCIDRTSIEEEDFNQHRPKEEEIPYNLDKKKLLNPPYSKYYKMIGGKTLLIERMHIFDKNDSPIKNPIRDNLKVSVRVR